MAKIKKIILEKFNNMKKKTKEPTLDKKQSKGKEKWNHFIDETMEMGAEAVEAVDEFQEIWSEGMKTIGKLAVNAGARIVTAVDNGMLVMDRIGFKLKYKFLKAFHAFVLMVRRNAKDIIKYSTGILIVSIALISLLNYATGYEYSYKGRTLGLVKDQEDVYKVIGLVNEGLTEKYGTTVDIDPETDIEFIKTFVLNKQVDDIDSVLQRLSNLSDTQAECYAIEADGKVLSYVETKEEAQNVLDKITGRFVKKSKKSKYEKVGFKEDVKIVKTDTILGNIKSESKAYKKIMEGKKGEAIYKVRKGDTASGICSKFDISMKKLRKLNPKKDFGLLHVGEKMVVSQAVASITVQTREVTTYEKKIKYKTKYKKSSNIYKGDTRVYRAGVYGTKDVTSRITRNNGKKTKEDVLKQVVTKKPVTKIVLKGTKKRPPTIGSGAFRWPVSGFTLTSYFGYRWGTLHRGLDLACSTGTPIHASDGGTVVIAGIYGGYGYCIEIDHRNGYHTRYGHCSSLGVSVGQKVYKGEYIGAVGNTGNSYGSHCHFEIIKNGNPVNPLNYLP